MKGIKKLSVLLLIAIMVIGFAACAAPEGGEIELITVTNGETIGDGGTDFPLAITDKDGEKIEITIKTDEDTVGEALVNLGLIAGEESDYGLYVKTVNGVLLDYDQDGMYWAFYVDGAYATSGVDQTAIEDGVSYEFKAE